jgi:hypothetical protein
MVEVPENEITIEHLMQWYKMQEDLAKLKSAEALLRARIFKKYFPTPVEGTNDFSLDDGYVLKAKYSIDRKVDEATLTTLTPDLRKLNIPLDALIKYKPELSVKAYRTLEGDSSDEGKKRLNLFDQCLIIKPAGTQQLEIVLPKKK